MTDTQNRTVSAVIPCNDANLLDRTVHSLLSQTQPIQEIIVIADGIAIPPNELFKISRNDKRIGKALSVNKGAEMARGDLILMVDADTYLAPDAVEQMVPYLHGEIKIVVPMVYPSRVKTAIERARRRIYATEGVVACGCCFLCERDFLLKFPIPNDTLVEDTAWASRARKKGDIPFQARRATCLTDDSVGYVQLVRRMIRWNYGGLQLEFTRNQLKGMASLIAGIGIPLLYASMLLVSALSLSLLLGIFTTFFLLATLIAIGNGSLAYGAPNFLAMFIASLMFTIKKPPTWVGQKVEEQC